MCVEPVFIQPRLLLPCLTLAQALLDFFCHSFPGFLSWSHQMFPQFLGLYKDMRKPVPLGKISEVWFLHVFCSRTINWSLASCFQPTASVQRVNVGGGGWSLDCTVPSLKKDRPMAIFSLLRLIGMLFLLDQSCLWQRLDIFDLLHFSWPRRNLSVWWSRISLHR